MSASSLTTDVIGLYCATSFAELVTSCTTAVNCSNQTCPSGWFCFAFECQNNEVPVSSTNTTSPPPTTNYAVELASNLHVTIEMEQNFNHTANCTMADWNLCYTKNVFLDYWGSDDYTNNQFKIFFSSIHRVLQVNHPDFEYQHVVGDLTYLKPSSTFQKLQSNSTTIEIPLVFEYWSVQETDNMPRWFVVDERDQSSAMIENTNTEDLHNFVSPYASTMKTESDANMPMTNATNRFLLNEKTVMPGIPFSERVIPAPLKTVVRDDAKSFTITGFSMSNADLLDTLRAGAADLLQKLGLNGMGSYRVSFSLETLPSDIAGPESYILEIAEGGTFITGSDAQGLFHGLVSFIGLLDVSNSRQLTLKEMAIYDKPRFEHRGHQVDVARNFHTKEAIEKTIDAMSLWKLNFLHLSLTNDEGWRLEIPGLEELTSVGAKRCFDLKEETCLLTQLGSGPFADEHQFYSREEYIDLVQYAHARNVHIIPEFNMPAHARAAVMAMEARSKSGDNTYRLTDPDDLTYLLTVQFYDRKSFINPCLDSSLRFVEKLVAEVKLMHDEAGVPLDKYHFGGDEVKNILLGAGYSSVAEQLKQQPFSKSPACQAKIIEDPTFDIEKIANYWAIKVNKILAQNGVQTMLSWEDGLRGTTKDQFETSSVAVHFWETLYWGGIDGLAAIANDGFDVIMANPDYLYFDFPYEVHPEERGFYWGARFNSVYKVFTFAPENFAQNAETSRDRDGNEMSITTPAGAVAPNIQGMQGQTWSETIRTTDEYYEMVFPRMLAVAERAWHRASWELDWSPNTVYNLTTGLVPLEKLAEDYNGFVSALSCRELSKIRKLGISYRVPPPGAKIDESGILVANSELPCTTTSYSADKGKTWKTYISPVNICSGLCGNQSVSLRSESADGALKSRVVVINVPNQSSPSPTMKMELDIIPDSYIYRPASPSVRLFSCGAWCLFYLIDLVALLEVLL